MFAFQVPKVKIYYSLIYCLIIVVHRYHFNCDASALRRTTRTLQDSTKPHSEICPLGRRLKNDDCSCRICADLVAQDRVLLLTVIFPSDIPKANIYLFDAKNYKECSYNNLTNIDRLENIVVPTERRKYEHTFRNRDVGAYCVGIELVGSKPAEDYDYITVTNITRIGDIEISPRQSSQHKGPNWNYVAVGCLVALGLLLAALIFFYRNKINRCFHRSTGAGSDRLTQLQSVDSLDFSEKMPAKVFIVYCHDCHHHDRTVEAFAEFLKKCNCEVSYDKEEQNDIAVSPQAWILEKINSDNKIIVVNSFGAYNMQQKWLNGTINNLSKTEKYDGLFLNTLVTLMNKMDKAFDYRNIFMIRFEYTERDHIIHNIVPQRRYQIPSDLPQLLSHIHGLDRQIEENAFELDSELMESVKQGYQCECWKGLL